MAVTSGKINTITVTRDTMIVDALEDLRVLLDGGNPSAGDITAGARKLNFLIKKWAIKGLLLWCRDTIQIPLVTNKFRYTIGPTGDVVTYRPLRVLEYGSFIRQTCGNTFPPDIPLTLLSRREYMELSQKSMTGTPNSHYYDPQMAPSPLQSYDPALANGVWYCWTAPVDLTQTAFIEVQRPIQDMTSGAESFDLPLEWYEAISKNLSAALSDKYEIPEQRLRRIKEEAKEAIDEIADWGSQEVAPISFQPDMSTWRGMR